MQPLKHQQPFGISSKASTRQPHSVLSLRGLKALVRLGWSAQERSIFQKVLFDVAIRFEGVPTACESDELSETICYGELSVLLRELCQSTEFKLIEHLGSQAYRLISERVGSRGEVWLRVNKIHAPIPELLGGASFSIGLFEPGVEMTK